MQKVEIYHKLLDAKYDMEKYIEAGWRIHTCTIAGYMAGYTHCNDILVIYKN